jgi:hypothetical protein
MNSQYGQGNDCYAITPDKQVISGTTPIVSTIVDGRGLDSISFQLVTVDEVIPVTSGTAAVVASTKTYTISAIDFTSRTGVTIRISGAAHPENNGDHVVTSVTSAHVVVCSGDSGLVNETFNLATATIQIIGTDNHAHGAWTIEASNNYQPNEMSVDGQRQDPGDWTDITDQFNPAIVAVTAPGSQWTQANIRCRDIRATFTPASGAGKTRANVNGKSYGL